MDVRVGLWRKLNTEELMLLNCVLEKTLESSLDGKEIPPVHPKGNQYWVFIGKTDVEAETPIIYNPWDCKESDTTDHTWIHTRTHTLRGGTPQPHLRQGHSQYQQWRTNWTHRCRVGGDARGPSPLRSPSRNARPANYEKHITQTTKRGTSCKIADQSS